MVVLLDGYMKKWYVIFMTLALFVNGQVWAAASRIVSVGGTVTEIVYALDQGHRLVADDISSVYPPQAQQLPKVGYYRQLSSEGLLSINSDLILASENAGPPHVLKQLKDLGVKVVLVSDKHSIESLYERIQVLAETLGVPDKGQVLEAQVRKQLATAQAQKGHTRSTLFLVNRSGNYVAAGTETTPAVLIKLAGLENAFQAQKGYKPITKESLYVLNPEIVVITSASVAPGSTIEQLIEELGLHDTDAGIHKRLLVMDDLLALGLGVRTAQAVELLKKISLQGGAE